MLLGIQARRNTRTWMLAVKSNRITAGTSQDGDATLGKDSSGAILRLRRPPSRTGWRRIIFQIAYVEAYSRIRTGGRAPPTAAHLACGEESRMAVHDEGQMAFDFDELARKDARSRLDERTGAPLRFTTDYYPPRALDEAFAHWCFLNSHLDSYRRSHMWHRSITERETIWSSPMERTPRPRSPRSFVHPPSRRARAGC